MVKCGEHTEKISKYTKSDCETYKILRRGGNPIWNIIFSNGWVYFEIILQSAYLRHCPNTFCYTLINYSISNFSDHQLVLCQR